MKYTDIIPFLDLAIQENLEIQKENLTFTSFLIIYFPFEISNLEHITEAKLNS